MKLPNAIAIIILSASSTACVTTPENDLYVIDANKSTGMVYVGFNNDHKFIPMSSSAVKESLEENKVIPLAMSTCKNWGYKSAKSLNNMVYMAVDGLGVPVGGTAPYVKIQCIN